MLFKMETRIVVLRKWEIYTLEELFMRLIRLSSDECYGYIMQYFIYRILPNSSSLFVRECEMK